MKLLILRFLVILLSITFSTVFAGNDKSEPTKLGPYKIGHTTMVMTDITRNANGSPGSGGRPLYLHIWYPSNGGNGSLTQYSYNNPLYDGSHSGFGKVIFSESFQSPLGARDEIPLANDKFPLIIYSHGSNGNVVGSLSTNELLASQGYIVVGVEHTGNSSSSAAAGGLGLPTPILTGRMQNRSLDVRFVITQMLDEVTDPRFQKSINTNKIGLFGYSLGGGTTMLTVSGLASNGMAPDTRIKAAIAMDGTDFVGLTAADYANVKIPMMLFSDANDVNRFAFGQLINSHPKYYADTSAALHIPQNDPLICNIVHSFLSVMNTNSSPTPESVLLTKIIDVFDVYTVDEYASCSSSIFQGISDSTLANAGANVPEINQLKPLMPLRKQVSLTEMERLMKWYVVSFFNKELKQDNSYARFLDPKENLQKNPLVDFAQDCRQDPTVALNIKNGDKITYTPSGNNKYKVSYSSGNALEDKGTINLNLGDDDEVSVALPFSFSMFDGPLSNQILVGSNGYIIAPTTDLSNVKVMPLVYSGGSPWVTGGETILNGLNTIAPLVNDLTPAEAAAGHGVFATVESNRVIITYDQVPMCCGIPDSINTFQVIINKNGTIEMIYGDMANTGPIYQTGWLGTVGIASNNAQATDLRNGLVDFSSLNKPKSINATAIYQNFFIGAGGTACLKDNH